MKTHSFRRGFTLVEMLTVITIIVILAALTFAGMGYVNDKQARTKAKLQIELLSNAIEEYKLDNGIYPTGGELGLPAGGTGGDNESNLLYWALYWDTDNDGQTVGNDDDQKVYLADLDPNTSKQGWIDGTGSDVKILDPWGNEYRYRVGTDANARNPDFDLWSAGKDGQTSESSSDTDTTEDDIRNFGN
jgi:general secretion pathway protein G